MSNLTSLSLFKNQAVKPAFWFVVLGSALWGVDPLFRVLLLDYLSSTQIALLEHVILVLFMAPVLWKHRQQLRKFKLRHIGALLFVSWGGSALATVLFTKGLASGDLNSVLLLQKLQPLFAILMARWMLKERLPRSFGMLFLIAIFGTYLLTFGVKPPFSNIHEMLKAGSLMSIGAALLWGGSTVMGRYLLRAVNYETVTSLRFILALPLLLAMTLGEHQLWTLPSEASGTAMIGLNLLLQALLPGLLSLLLYYKGLSAIKASYATLAELSFPMVGVLINYAVFHQATTFTQIMGFILIWATLLVLSRQQERSVQSEGVIRPATI
ncbi:EamA domain-containing membrane protein RarD [Paenibacillus cellulosilyticus]|uniref:EamA domain-containing membrane protein RarD n=1 Tax=Paenibacillus cellulosilyticus TaxID=375489 RepID=A0A2V2YU72_9BACL|nr:DMT family transporter [Paenibacillus cellulosilyticus]PWW02807.1 EamA domain-containing membrane protein RarD [Paenibacillus cellulosilyticus]QKS45729.1 DMT family transporter [Paenibacillus cellulosilyticus]